MSLQNKIANIIQGFKELLTGYMGVISSDHAYIHLGKGFNTLIKTGSISNAYYIGFTTPADSYVHWRPTDVATSADYVEIELYEGDSFTGGTAVTPINLNRLSSKTSTMQTIVKGATATPTGVLIQHAGLGTSGNSVSRSGGGSSAEQERVLKQNTNYVIEINPAGATDVTLTLFWYEEEVGV